MTLRTSVAIASPLIGFFLLLLATWIRECGK